MWFRVFLFLLLATPSWAGLPPTRILDEGTDKGIAFKFDCVGAGIVCSQSGVTGTLTVGTGAGGDSVSIDGVAVTDPNFNSTGDVDFVDTANVVTGTVVSVRPAAENSIEALLDLQDLQGAVTDGQVPNTITIDLATTATTANAGDSATAFFSAGSIESARGGTGTDSSGATGIARIDAGVWSASELSGDVVTSGSNVTTIQANSVALTTDTSGNYAAGDAEAGNVAADKVLESSLKAVDAAVDEECLTYETTTGDFEWQTCGAGGGDSISIDGVAVVDPNFASTGDIDFVDTSNTVTANINANAIVDGDLATTESINLPVYSAKLTGAFVVRTPTSGDDSTQGAQIDAGDGNWRLLFDATTDEGAVWQFRLPDYWAAHGEVNIFYTMTSATTLEVEFEVDVMCVSDGDAADVGTASFAGVAVGSATVPGTAGYPDEISVTVTDDACAAGDMMWIYLSTDANDAVADDATGDREIIGVEYEFTR